MSQDNRKLPTGKRFAEVALSSLCGVSQQPPLSHLSGGGKARLGLTPALPSLSFLHLFSLHST